LKGASTSLSVRAVCSASSVTIPWLFLGRMRKSPSGVRRAVQRWPLGVRVMWKSVRCSVGELNPLEAICTATSFGSNRTLPPLGRPGICSQAVCVYSDRLTSAPLITPPKTSKKKAITGPASSGRSVGRDFSVSTTTVAAGCRSTQSSFPGAGAVAAAHPAWPG
jgi:hypothetical protein